MQNLLNYPYLILSTNLYLEAPQLYESDCSWHLGISIQADAEIKAKQLTLGKGSTIRNCFSKLWSYEMFENIGYFYVMIVYYD